MKVSVFKDHKVVSREVIYTEWFRRAIRRCSRYLRTVSFLWWKKCPTYFQKLFSDSIFVFLKISKPPYICTGGKNSEWMSNRALQQMIQIIVVAIKPYKFLWLEDRVRIQKPVVTYDLGKSSVTSCARLPNYLKIYL
jgi:hypothetical protein